MRFIALTTLALGLSACSAPQVAELRSDPPDATMVKKPSLTTAARSLSVAVPPLTDDTLICREEIVTGSHIPRRRCRTARQLHDMRVNIQAWLLSGRREGGFSLVR